MSPFKYIYIYICSIFTHIAHLGIFHSIVLYIQIHERKIVLSGQQGCAGV